MNNSQFYILISIIVLAVIMVILAAIRKKMGKPLSRLAALAFAFIMAGIIFGEDRMIGYSLIGIGVTFAIVDIIKKIKESGVKSD